MAKKEKKNKEKRPSNPSKLKVTKEREAPLLMDREWYKATLDQASFGDGKYGEYCRLQFTVKNGYLQDEKTTAKGAKVSALCDAALALNSQMYNFIVGIVGYEPSLSDEIDITPFYGDTYEVNIETKKKKGQDKSHSNVVKIRQLKKKKSKNKDKKKSKNKDKK